MITKAPPAKKPPEQASHIPPRPHDTCDICWGTDCDCEATLMLLFRRYRPGPGFSIFRLRRHRDVSGVSGTGVVAIGIARSNNTAVMRWISTTPSDAVFDHWHHIDDIHGHHGATRLEWITAISTNASPHAGQS